MVTHGYLVFKYKGMYYAFYNHSDSYFENLGNIIVKEINQMVNNDFVKYYKSLLLRIPLKGNQEGSNHIDAFYYLLKYPDAYNYFISYNQPDGEYIYTIDFDDSKFIADKYGENIYSFNLYDVPDNWYEITQNYSNYDENQDDNNNDNDNDNDDIHYDDESSEESKKSLDKSNEAILNKIKILENTINKLKLKLK